MPKKKQKPSIGLNWKKQLEKRNDFGCKKRKGSERRLKLGKFSVIKRKIVSRSLLEIHLPLSKVS